MSQTPTQAGHPTSPQVAVAEPIAPATSSITTPLSNGDPWSPANRILTIGLLMTIVGVAFEGLAVATTMPATADDLGGLSLYGWVFSAFMLTNLVGITLAGGEADLRGPARPFVVGVICFVAGLLIGGLAPSMPALIAGRAIQGFGGGIIGSVAYVTIGRGYSDASKPRMLALLSTAWVVPGLIGPALAGLIADHVGWRWVFLGLVPFPVIALVLILPSLRRIPPGGATSRDRARIAGAVQLAAGTGIVLAGFGRSNPLLAVPLVIAGAAIAWPALRRLLPAGTLRGAAGMPAAIATMGLLNLGFFGVDAFLPLGLTDVRDRSASFAGLALTAATVTWTSGSWLQAHYARQISRRLIVRTGLILIALGSAGAILILFPSVSVLGGPITWAIAGLGMGLAYSSLSLTVLESAPSGHEGAATSSMQISNALGLALGTGIGGIFIAAFSTGDEASRSSLVIQNLVMIGVLGLALLIAGRLPATPDRAGDPQPG